MINGIMIGIPLTKKVKCKSDKLIMPIAHYSVVGKTNSDSDRAILKDLTGNGNDLTLYNFAFTSESGYNCAGGLVFDGVDDYGKNNNFPQLKKFTIIYKRSISRDIIMTAPLFSKKNENVTGEFVTEYMSDFIKEENYISICKQNYNVQTKYSIYLDTEDGNILYNTNIAVQKGNISNGLKDALSNILLIGKFAEKELFTTTFKGVFYEAYIFDKELTDEQINYYKSRM